MSIGTAGTENDNMVARMEAQTISGINTSTSTPVERCAGKKMDAPGQASSGKQTGSQKSVILLLNHCQS